MSTEKNEVSNEEVKLSADTKENVAENKNLKPCSVCGRLMATNSKSCPSCGAKNKKPIFKRWWFWAIIIIIILAVVGSFGENDTPTPTLKDGTANSESASEEPKEVEGVDYFGDGMYKVGADLPAGTYIVFGSGYAQLSSDSSGSLDSIISNENYSGTWYIEVMDGEYLEFNGGKAYPLETAPMLDTTSGILGDGMYKVGRDLPAGEYKVKALGTAYIEVTTSCRGNLMDIVSNDNFDSEKYITVSDGQFLKLSDCELSL